MCRLSWKHLLDAKTAAWSPEFFRRALRVSELDRRVLRSRLLPWQERDFRALDPAWTALAALPGAVRRPPYRRAYLERPRGHSKTFDTAVQIAWVLWAARHAVRGLAAAADMDQAMLLWDAVERLARLNPRLITGLKFSTGRIANPRTGSRVEFISSDVASSWGHDPDFVICDELCHWTRADLWHSLLSSSAKRPHCVLVVLSNAGAGRGWQREVREAARISPDWYFSSLRGPQAPWITPQHLAEQEQLLPRPVFERLWLNIWQESDGEFVTLAEAEACRDQSLVMQERGQPRLCYAAAIDYAEKHDLTVACLCHRDGERIVVDRMDVVQPSPSQPTRVQWVEEWIERIARDFQRTRFVVDEYQLVGVVQRLEQRHAIRRFPFRGGRGNHALAIALRNLIVERKVAWYPGCGAIADQPERDDLETELAALLVRQTRGGHLRIDHLQDGRHHDDRAFALGAACLELLGAEGEGDYFEVTLPREDGLFDW